MSTPLSQYLSSTKAIILLVIILIMVFFVLGSLKVSGWYPGKNVLTVVADSIRSVAP